jgi:hypothetical protein
MKEVKEVSQIDWARLAAYIDGEGCIRLHLQNPSPGNTYHGRHLLEVRVYSTDPRLPLWCKNTFGGGGYNPVGRRGKSHHKQEVVWYAGGEVAEWILRNCLPYFIIKSKQAECALAFRELVGKRGKRITPEIYTQRELLRQEMKVLNQRGALPAQEN